MDFSIFDNRIFEKPRELTTTYFCAITYGNTCAAMLG
jgi:hypothetical protein